MVEHAIENRSVGGSIPSLGTIFFPVKDGEKSAWEFRETLKDTRFTERTWARYHAAAARYDAIEREARQRPAGS